MRSAGAFGRRASDGGANLHIYYPTSNNNGQPVETMYSSPNSRECLRSTEQKNDIPCLEDESNDEIQR